LKGWNYLLRPTCRPVQEKHDSQIKSREFSRLYRKIRPFALPLSEEFRAIHPVSAAHHGLYSIALFMPFPPD
jgi:hypothetical protein